MKILLDTHVLIWFTDGNEKLSKRAQIETNNPNNDKFISVVSLWEIVIKSSLNKLELKRSFTEINQILFLNNIQIIPVELNHLEALLSLPYYHNDPFDRLIISQAISENLTIISADRHFSSYPVQIIW